ncbi:hypothetical protein CRYUN_Cryun04dG0081700 [Craigia yunnanensis]
MIEGYVQSEKAEISLKLFREMVSEDGIQPNGVTAANVLKAYGRLKDIYMEKLVHGVVIRRGDYDDLFLGNSLIDMYSKCWKTFDGLKGRDVMSWNIMIPNEAIRVFCEMSKTQEKPTAITFINLLEACSLSVKLRMSKWV